ncbi:MAG: PLP-dependent transferase, partial [Acidimicrobiia bacterium]
MEFETKAIHAGQDPEPVTGSVVPPIYATSTYHQRAPGVHSGFEYSRTDNPTRTVLQTALAALEGVD